MHRTCWATLLLTLGVIGAVVAQTPGDPPTEQTANRLANQQGELAAKYTKLEKLLDEMARIEAVSNPRRASLLMQALKQSKAELTAGKLDQSVQLLSQKQLKLAVDKQREAYKDMEALLKLLLSENRSDRLKREQDRIREYIKEVERILRLQRSVQGRTEGGGEPRSLAQDQGKIANRTDELAKRIQENEEGASQPGQEDQQDQQDREGTENEPKDGQDKPKEDGGEGEGQPKDNPQDGNQQNRGDKPSSGESEKPADAPKDEAETSEPSDAQGKSNSKNKSGKAQNQGQGQSQPQDDQQDPQKQQEEPPQEDDHPARNRLQAAEQRMREAQKKLDEAKRSEAIAEQEKAREELERAKAELEKILRQLREEEVERMLALLEGRFRKMLELQLRIYEDTKSLSKSKDELRRQKDSGELAVAERKLVVDADKALNLLLEEGSSIAFPETVTQLRNDMQQVSERLDGAKVGVITQAIEEDVIAALEDMVQALQKAQQDLEDQEQQQQQQQQAGQPGEMPLVDVLAELKMVRALQVRVNNRTARYAQELDNVDDLTGQATEADLREALADLAERQESIYRITRDLVLGKNK